MLSIIIPSYNEEGNVAKCASVVSKLLSENDIDYELVFVNDGSKDRTWDIISNLARNDEHIVGVNFSRNFGKESAIFAGLETAKGDACVLLDCDLQFPPEVIIEMYNIWKNNDVDIVEGRKNSRGKENPVYKFFSLWFYKMINKSSGLDMEAASDFKLLDRAVVDSLNAMPERLTFFRAMSSWVGYKTERVYFDVADREIGESKWSVKGLFKFAINSITSFTSAPLQIVTVCGVITFIFSVILGLHTLIKKLIKEAFASEKIVLIENEFGEIGIDGGFMREAGIQVNELLTSSIIMFSLGIIGFYLSKIYEEIKQRPRYIIRDIIRKDDEEKKNGKD